MSRKFVQITFSILLLAGMLFGFAVKDGALANPLAAKPQADSAAKIESLVLQQLSAGPADFIVTMSKQADTSGAAQLQTKEEKGQYVFNTLVDFASKTQTEIRAYLDTQSAEYQSFYVFNGLWVKGGTLELAKSLAARGDVAKITANHTYQLEKPINPQASTDAPNFVEPNISFVKADQVWAMGYTGQGTVMGDDDTGLDWTHPAITRHYRGCLNPPDCTNVDHNYNWYDAFVPSNVVPWDDYGHGTHTAGTMVGDDGAGNQIGMAPGAQVVACKNMNGGGGDDAHFIICFQWNLAPWDLNGQNPRPDLAADSVNNSWGYWGGGVNSFREVIDNLLAAGIVVEVSAGNEGSGCSSLRSPGDYQEVYTTGSVNHAAQYPGTITGFSSRGPSKLDGNYFPDFMAPGENVRSSLPGNQYAYWSGTSMAGPHVTALIGLIWSANPALIGQVQTTYDIIRQTVTPLTGQNGSNCGGDYTVGPNNDWGYGTIDSLAAVQLAISYGGAGTLQGTVLDAVTQLPVANATVKAVRQEGGNWTATTDGAGFYSLTVAAGTFDITVSHPKYMAGTANNVVVLENGTTVQDFSLTPRGWAYGYVYDFDNNTPIVGATVTAEDNSFATTDVNGYYELWLDPGLHTLTAVAPNYAPDSALVEIVSGFGTQQNFFLQAAVVFIPTPIEVTVPLGQTSSVPATILNRLPYDYPFEFQEKDLGYLPLGGKEVKLAVNAGPAAAPANTAVAFDGYKARPAGTISITQHSGINVDSVLLLNADDDNNGFSPIQQALLAYGDIATVDLFDARYATPTLAQLQAYNVVVVWSNYVFSDRDAMGNVLADYVDAGGKVIDLMFSLDPYWGMGGRFANQGYSAMTTAGVGYNFGCLGTFDPTNPIMAGITDVCDLFRGYATALTAGSSEVARWADNELFVAAKDDGSVVTINGYVGTYYQWTGQMPDVLHNAINAIGVPADVSWLSEVPPSGVVPATSQFPVAINFDASLGAGVSQPGTYSAELTVKGTPKVKVPVTMFVQAPADWGRLDGTVIGLGYCDQKPGALKDAVVEIVGVGTLTTDANGYFATWLQQGTYTLIVTAAGHVGATATVVVVPQGNTTQDFSLRWDQPCITEAPPSMSVTLDMGASTVQQMTLTNTGAGTGTFEMSDNQKGYTPMRQNFLPAAVRPSTPDTTPSTLGRDPNAAHASPADLGKAIAAMVGEPAFAVDVYPGQSLVTFLDDNPSNWTVIAGLPGNQYFGGDFVNGDFNTLYVVDYGTNSLYTVNTTNGAVTLIGPSVPGSGEAWTGLSGASDGTMYGVGSTCGSSTLYTVDLSTGSLTTIGAITNGPCVIDIAATPSGELFGIDIVNDNLLSIDPATGAGTIIGYLGVNANYAQGMDYEDTSGTLYWAAYTSSGELRIIDPATGNSTLVGGFPGGDEVDSLAFATGGGGDAPWLSENPASGTIPGTPSGLSAPTHPAAAGEPVANPGLTLNAPASQASVIPAKPVHPEDVLWDQPQANYNAYADQDFEAGFDAFDIFVADDFTNLQNWTISTIYVPGRGWNPGGDLTCANSLNWQIYADNGGVPAGDPWSGGAIWSISLPPSDPQVTLSANGFDGFLTDATLNLTTPVDLAPGTYWLVYYPQLDFSTCFQFGRSTATTTNGTTGMVINPGGGFGMPTVWSPAAPLYGFPEYDFAFRLEGTAGGGGGNTQTIDVTFDAGQVTQPGTYTGEVKAKTNDPVVKNYTVAATMVVKAPANWGQLQGTVFGLGYCDANPAPLKGAQVAIQGGLTVPTDANGYYLLWLPEGSYNVTVTADGHTIGTATVQVNPGGQVTTQDFNLRWTQPCMSETPTSFTATLDLGQTETQLLTLTNDGAAEGTFAIADVDKGYTPKLAQKPSVPAGNPVVVTGSSTNAPVQLYNSRINANDILVISTTDTSQSLERALNELGYAYDYYNGTPWTGIDFTPYNTVLVAMDGGAAEIADIAKLRTDVIDQGKKLFFFGGTCYQPFAQGMNDYLVQNDTGNYCWQVTNPPQWTVTDPTHPLADGLPDQYNYSNMSAGYYSIRVTDPEAEQVAVNGENWPALFRKQINGPFMWFIDSAYSSYWMDAGDFGFLKQLINNVMTVSGGGDAVWLSENPAAGVVAPDGGTQVVDVVFDASQVTQPGTYMAEIKVKTSDPVNSRYTVPVTMNVNGPLDWGRVEGVVSGLGYCDKNPVVLKGATVQIVGGQTLTTDAAGHYSTWIKEGTYQVDVSMDGHTGATATVVIVAQQTTTQNFDLRLLTPCVSEAPASLEVTMTLNKTKSVPLTLTNLGAAQATFSASDLEKGFTPKRQNFLPAAVRPTTPDTSISSVGRAPNAPFLPAPEAAQSFLNLVGEPAFAMDLFYSNLVTFTSDNPGTFTTVGAEPGTAWFAGDFINGDFSTMYVLDYYSNSLYSVDTTNGATTLIGPSVPNGSWTGMTGAVDGTMYASATTCGSSTLYTVDLTNGALTTIGEVTNAPCLIDIAITPDGTMYGVDIVNDNLVSIDPATGAGTIIGYIGFNANYAQGMDYEESTGTLYLAAFNIDTFQGELRIADPATGNSTLVGAFMNGAEVDALAWATGGGKDALWLSENPATGVVAPDGGLTVINAVFDTSAVTELGTYTAELTIKTNDAVNKKFVIPVTLHVIDSFETLLPIVSK